MRSRNDGFACPAAANFASTASISRPISSFLNTAVATAVAWSFHGSKNASPPDCAMVGAIAGQLLVGFGVQSGVDRDDQVGL